MEIKHVKDLMVPLDKYALVDENASLLEAVEILEEVQKKRDRSRQPYRAVLIIDKNKKVVGKLGELGFLKALEPEHDIMADMSKLRSAGVSSTFLHSMMSHYRFFQDSVSDLCARARHIKVKEVMQPATDSIDENATMEEAIYKIVTLQSLSILVTRKGETVGLLRLPDLCQEIAEKMKECK
jgi:CBS domain-containing protein